MKGTEMQSFGTSTRKGHDSSRFYQRRMFADDNTKRHSISQRRTPEKEFAGDLDSINKIHTHSATEMHHLPDNSIHLMVTSPPYNVGKDYDKDLTEYEYSNLLFEVWQEVHRVLVPGGRACINIANIGRKPYLSLNSMIVGQMCELGYLMRGEIIWDKGASAGSSCAWGSWKSPSNPVLRDTHEYILVFSKGEYRRQAQDKVATITREEFLSYTKSIWSFTAESARRVNHPAPFPVELPQRLIQLYSYKKDIVLDPFMGSGTTALAALRRGRYYVGYEIDREYVRRAEDRIRKEKGQNEQQLK